MLSKSQSGIAHLHIIVAFVVVGVIAFTGGMVYNAQQKREDARTGSTNLTTIDTLDGIEASQAEKAKSAQSDDQKNAVDLPAEEKNLQYDKTPAPNKQSSTSEKPQKTEPKQVSIGSTSSVVNTNSVVLTAQLPGSYKGTCKVLVKHPDGNNSQWHDAVFGPASSCSITVPKDKLSSSNKWQFYMYFYSEDYSVKGSSGGNSFTL